MRHHLRHTITLYTETEEGFIKAVVTGVSVRMRDSLDKGISATVYMPLAVRRKIKYLPPEEFSGEDRTFTVKAGQLALPYACASDSPPDDALTVGEISYATMGSPRTHHLKIRLIYPQKEEPTYEGTDS